MHIHSLLQNEIRPLPLAPTHFVLVEVINTDLSIKRITIYFNPEDQWGNPCPTFTEKDKDIGLFISQYLPFLGRDEKAMAWQCYVVEISTQRIVSKASNGIKENPKYPL